MAIGATVWLLLLGGVWMHETAAGRGCNNEEAAMYPICPNSLSLANLQTRDYCPTGVFGCVRDPTACNASHPICCTPDWCPNYGICSDHTGFCEDVDGQLISHGQQFSNDVNEPCSLCTCINGRSENCQVIACAEQPRCRGARMTTHRCCEYDCPVYNLGEPIKGIRLIGGSSPREGRVEILLNNTWGTICDSSFNEKAARVVCRMLGYDAPTYTAVVGSFAPGAGPIHIPGIRCVGNEPSVWRCMRGVRSCTHYDDVSVSCLVTVAVRGFIAQPPPQSTLSPGGTTTTDFSSTPCIRSSTIRLVDGPTEKTGRVEVFHNRQWGTVCDDLWGVNNAKVVCRSLCFDPKYAQVYQNRQIPSGNKTIWLDNVQCNGNEFVLERCEHAPWGSNNCFREEDVAVTCEPFQSSSRGAATDQNPNQLPIQVEVSMPHYCDSNDCLEVAKSVLGSMNQSADPCEDFYEFACGGFEKFQNMSATSGFDQFAVAQTIIHQEVRDILESSEIPAREGSARRKSRLYYKSCLNVENATTNGLVQVRKMIKDLGGFLLDKADTVPASWTLENLMVKSSKYSGNTLFSLLVTPDMKHVVDNTIFIAQTGLGLGEGTQDYYIGNDVTNDSVLTAYTNKLQSFARTIVGHDEVDRDLIVDVVLFEQHLAEIQVSLAEISDGAASYNKFNISWLETNLNFLNWTRYFGDVFGRVGISINQSEPIVAYGLHYFLNLTTLINQYKQTNQGRRTLQNYFIFQDISQYSEFLGDLFEEASETFNEIFQGIAGKKERWKACLADTDSALGFALGAMYVEQYFTPSDKKRATELVADVVGAFRARLTRAFWMANETRKSALDKLDALTFDVGYPDNILNETYLNERYQNLTVTEDYAANSFAAYLHSFNHELAKLRKRPDRSNWYQPPLTVNAYYDPTRNEIIIPAGFLKVPFYYTSNGVPAVLNYGAIGSIIGHEITHGFDNNGRQYDKFGDLLNWWDDVTAGQFDKRAQCMTDQYGNYESDGLYLRGDQTLPENIADNGGLMNSFYAYKAASEDGRLDSGVRLKDVNLTPDQLFFVGFAQVSCIISTPESLKLSILQDQHAPSQFRVLGVLSNSAEFAKAFKCQPRSTMNPDTKCQVW